MHCPQCGTENKNRYCKECGRLLKPRRYILPVLIVLILLYFLLDTVVISVPVKTTKLVDTPLEIHRHVNSSTPISRLVCSNRSFRYSGFAGNVDSIGMYARPYLRIINMEEAWGKFMVNFSFIDEEKFPYEIYGGENLNEMLELGKISSSDADFYSQNYEFYLGPGEEKVLQERTLKPEDKEYWAIADVAEPIKEECKTVVDNQYTLENRTFTEYKTERKTVTTYERKSLMQAVGFGYLEWLIIILLLGIILFLYSRIRSAQHRK